MIDFRPKLRGCQLTRANSALPGDVFQFCNCHLTHLRYSSLSFVPYGSTITVLQ